MKPNIAHSIPVRVSLPASVAADIGSLKEAVGSILDKLGCAACCSGHDIYLELQRDVMFRDIEAAAIPSATRALSLTNSRITRAGIDPAYAAKTSDVFSIIDRIADLTGHPACCSGNDLFMQSEYNFVMNNKFGIKKQAFRLG